MKDSNPYQKYGINDSLCDLSGNIVYTHGVSDDWLLWELEHGNDVNLEECLKQSKL